MPHLSQQVAPVETAARMTFRFDKMAATQAGCRAAAAVLFAAAQQTFGAQLCDFRSLRVVFQVFAIQVDLADAVPGHQTVGFNIDSGVLGGVIHQGYLTRHALRFLFQALDAPHLADIGVEFSRRLIAQRQSFVLVRHARIAEHRFFMPVLFFEPPIAAEALLPARDKAQIILLILTDVIETRFELNGGTNFKIAAGKTGPCSLIKINKREALAESEEYRTSHVRPTLRKHNADYIYWVGARMGTACRAHTTPPCYCIGIYTILLETGMLQHDFKKH
jgi:hypothetical protein